MMQPTAMLALEQLRTSVATITEGSMFRTFAFIGFHTVTYNKWVAINKNREKKKEIESLCNAFSF